MAETEILLESGTNEMEIMEFKIYGESYGINVAKVRDVYKRQILYPMHRFLLERKPHRQSLICFVTVYF